MAKQNKGNYLTWGVIGVILIGGLVAGYLMWSSPDNTQEGTWMCQNGEWVKQGNPTANKPARECEPEPGQEAPSKQEQVSLSQPQANKTLTSPVSVKGQAKGSWFFEGVLPVRLETRDGQALAEGSLQAQGEWMTEEMVPFAGELEYEVSSSTEGFLVIKKSNPSGLPENEDRYQVPVVINP